MSDENWMILIFNLASALGGVAIGFNVFLIYHSWVVCRQRLKDTQNRSLDQPTDLELGNRNRGDAGVTVVLPREPPKAANP